MPALVSEEDPLANPENTPNPEVKYDQRATHYYSDQQMLDLEVLMLQIRTRYRKKVGKSELARLALDMLLSMPLDEVAARVKEEE